MFLQRTADQQNPHNIKNSERTVTKEKPTALLIGTSNTERIDEQKLSSSVNVAKVTAYTLDETHNVIDNTQVKPDVVIIHALTNDVNNLSPNECTDRIGVIVDNISTKWKDTKTVISLTTPRLDNRIHRLNSEILDGLIKMKYLNNKDVYVSDNSNMQHGSVPLSDLLNRKDNFHLSQKGVSMLASNMKNALHTVLGIKNQHRYRYSDSPKRFSSSPNRYSGSPNMVFKRNQNFRKAKRP